MQGLLHLVVIQNRDKSFTFGARATLHPAATDPGASEFQIVLKPPGPLRRSIQDPPKLFCAPGGNAEGALRRLCRRQARRFNGCQQLFPLSKWCTFCWSRTTIGSLWLPFESRNATTCASPHV